ncbi:hypothetical protein EYZ11_013405 [Aspergillus tanneri]|uniref:Uncharacterized protein n=1 Tax=Aspergillus tanneri TaxID=1220188 RepID=A0A4S3IXQ7_9EURO|nr:hypothetical protein EYZ11_013405 [Aspergillus tanneri]
MNTAKTTRILTSPPNNIDLDTRRTSKRRSKREVIIPALNRVVNTIKFVEYALAEEVEVEGYPGAGGT